LTTTVSTITMLAWAIPEDKPATLSTDEDRLPAMARVDDPELYTRLRDFFIDSKDRLVSKKHNFSLVFDALGPFQREMFPHTDDGEARLSDYIVMPSLEAKSSSVRDTAYAVFATMHAFRADLPCARVDVPLVVDSEPARIIDKLSVIDDMYDCVSNHIVLMAIFHLQKHLLEASFCDPHNFVYFWVDILVSLDYRAEAMETTSKGMKSSLSRDDDDEVEGLELEGDEAALDPTEDGSVLEVVTAEGVTPVESTAEALLTARMEMEEESDEEDSVDDDGAGEPSSAAAPKTGGLSHKEKQKMKVKYEKLLSIAQLLLVVWDKQAAPDVDNCAAREAVVEKVRVAYREAFSESAAGVDESVVIEWACKMSPEFQHLWNQMDNELRMMIEPFKAWVIHGDALPVHAHLAPFILLLIYYVNMKNWKQAKTPTWVIMYLAQTLYRWHGKEGKNRRDIMAAFGCWCKHVNDLNVELTNSVLRRSISRYLKATFKTVLDASMMINPRRAVAYGMSKLIGSKKKATKSEVERNEERAKSTRFSDAREKVRRELLRKTDFALAVALGKKASEMPRPKNKLVIGFEAVPAFLDQIELASNSDRFKTWPPKRKQRGTFVERKQAERDKEESRDKHAAKLQNNLTYKDILTAGATKLMDMAKTVMTSDEYRKTDETTGKRRALRKGELQELFLSKFGLVRPAPRRRPESSEDMDLDVDLAAEAKNMDEEAPGEIQGDPAIAPEARDAKEASPAPRRSSRKKKTTPQGGA
jgi:hypothetical protein